MKPKGYLVFHLNLAFSSIEKDSWPVVINTCYHPLLDLAENSGIPIGIELTGWTLKQIESLDPSWVKRLKVLTEIGQCELVGSGYCQIVGPLVPHTVNTWNQKLGLEVYKEVLNLSPKIALVNEMAFSSSLVDIYNQFSYKGLIMDRDNIKLALETDSTPSHAEGASGSKMRILWSDSILFQKLQHFAHGDISTNDYLTYLKDRFADGEKIFPIYCNDAEVFDYRPGRFNEERPTHAEGEWIRIHRILNEITSNMGLDFVLPSEALEISKFKPNVTKKFVTAAYPIPVKKQAKYNIARWAVTGKNDLWLNSICHRLEKKLSHSKDTTSEDWKNLCELWASDLRTHITEQRWNETLDFLDLFSKKHEVNTGFGVHQAKNETRYDLYNVIGNYGGSKIVEREEGIIVNISNRLIDLELNLRRGLAIKNLAFSSHKMEPCIGTLSHGHFSSISLGADYYSGGLVVELPVERKRFTDLELVKPKFSINRQGNIEISAKISTPLGIIFKTIEISTGKEKISLTYSFQDWSEIIGSMRLGIITLINQFSREGTLLTMSNGGEHEEVFENTGEFDHTSPVSHLVSSSRGLGATSGFIKVSNNRKSFNLKWNPDECAVMPMLQRKIVDQKTLSRVLFSMKETDDTSKHPSKIGNFSLEISAE